MIRKIRNALKKRRNKRSRRVPPMTVNQRKQRLPYEWEYPNRGYNKHWVTPPIRTNNDPYGPSLELEWDSSYNRVLPPPYRPSRENVKPGELYYDPTKGLVGILRKKTKFPYHNDKDPIYFGGRRKRRTRRSRRRKSLSKKRIRSRTRTRSRTRSRTRRKRRRRTRRRRR